MSKRKEFENILFKAFVCGKFYSEHSYKKNIDSLLFGRRVIATRDFDGRIDKGDKGYILIPEDKDFIGVKWDKKSKYFHDLGGVIDEYKGYFVPSKMLEFIEEEGL